MTVGTLLIILCLLTIFVTAIKSMFKHDKSPSFLPNGFESFCIVLSVISIVVLIIIGLVYIWNIKLW